MGRGTLSGGGAGCTPASRRRAGEPSCTAASPRRVSRARPPKRVAARPWELKGRDAVPLRRKFA